MFVVRRFLGGDFLAVVLRLGNSRTSSLWFSSGMAAAEVLRCAAECRGRFEFGKLFPMFF